MDSGRRRTLAAATAGALLALPTSRRTSSLAWAQAPGGKEKARRQQRPGGGRGGPIRIPVFLDLKQVPVGSWTEYTVSQGGRLPRTVRQVLVDRDKTSATVEVILQRRRQTGRPATQAASEPPPSNSKIFRMVVDIDLPGSAPKKLVFQQASGDPVELPTDQGSGRRRLFKLDPKTALGSETVVVGAGTFEAQHYQDVSPRGGTIDIWASTQAPPFGLVRMERKPGPNAPGRRAAFGQVTYALVRMGTGGKTSITKPIKPLDPALMQCRVGPKPFKH